MSITNSTAQTVELPPGVSHHTTTAGAETWGAWDALTDEDGWEERTWFVNRGTAAECLHRQKEATIRGHRVVVFPPHHPRTALQVARDILTESMRPIVTPEEDEAWRERENQS